MIAFCLRHKRLVLGLWGVTLLACTLVLARRITSGQAIIDNSVGVWFMKDDPELKLYEAFNDDFRQKEWSVLLVKADAIFAPAFLQDLAEITRRIEAVAHVTKVISITNVRDNHTTADGLLEYRRLYPARGDGAALGAAEVAAFRAQLAANPIFERSLLSAQDPRSTTILFENDNLINDPRPYRIAMVDAIKRVVGEYPRVRAYHLAGTSIINAELNRSSQHDVLVFYFLVTGFIMLIGFLSLRNWRDLAVVMFVVTAGALPPMALLALLGIPYNMVTVMLPPILITLSVCDVVHVINGFHLERRAAASDDAAATAVARIWGPCVWTSVVAGIGFLSLATSSVSPIRQMGLYSATGIALAWFITMTGAPALLTWLWPQQRLAQADRSKAVGLYARRVVPFLQGRWRWLWLGVAGLLLLGLGGLPRLEVDTNYTKFFGPDMYITRSYPEIRKAGYGENPIALVLRFAPGTSYASPGYLPRLLDFEAAVRADASVVKVMTFTDLLGRADLAFNGDAGRAGAGIRGYPQDKLEQLYLLAELGGNDDLRDFITADKRTVQVVAMTASMSSKDLEAFKRRIYAAAKLLPAGVDLKVTGTTVQWANMDKEISHTQMDSLYILTGVFLVLLPLIFRSWRLGAIGVLINALPMAITLGLMGWLDIKINIATALIGGVAIGATVDSTIFFINRVRLALAQGMTWDQAVDHAVITVGDGIIMTSLILAGGFVCLATSRFSPTANFGALVSTSIVIALFMDIIVNPIVLKLVQAGRPAPAVHALGLPQTESQS